MNKAVKYLKNGLTLRRQNLKNYKLDVSFYQGKICKRDMNKLKYQLRKRQKEVKDFENILMKLGKVIEK